MYVRGERQQHVHVYLETDFGPLCLVVGSFASPIYKDRVSLIEGPVGGAGGQGPASKDQESRF